MEKLYNKPKYKIFKMSKVVEVWYKFIYYVNMIFIKIVFNFILSIRLK